MKVMKLYEDARIPTKATPEAAGFDLYSTIDLSILPNTRALVPTGLSIQLEKGTYGRIAPRSKLANSSGIDVLAGVVDSDYRGEVMCLLYNTSDYEFFIKKGDSISQLIIEKYSVEDVEMVNSLEETERGNSGIMDVMLRLKKEELHWIYKAAASEKRFHDQRKIITPEQAEFENNILVKLEDALKGEKVVS